MKITAFNPLASELNALELTVVSFKKLDQIVVLAGPNGGGKSRILDVLARSATYELDRIEVRRNCERNIAMYEGLLREVEAGTRKDTQDVIESWRYQLSGSKGSLARIETVSLDKEVRAVTVVRLVPKRLELADPSDFPRSQIVNRAERIKTLGDNSLHEDALAYIQCKQDRYLEVTHQNYTGKDEEKELVEKEYSTLEFLIESLLRTKIGRSANSETTIFGKPLGSSKLSDGQKILLQFAVAVHPTHDDQSVVLIMDEPENHLHPYALIKMFDQIRSALPRAQLWIATHSVPLLAHLYHQHPDALHFVEGGTVTHAGSKPEIVLEGLVGDEVERAKLVNFIDLPERMAATRFASTCLVIPAVAEYQDKDSQLAQLRKLLTSVKKPDASLRVLDFGAGEARLLGGVSEGCTNVASEIDYVAFDTSRKSKNACERQLIAVYGSTDNRIYFDSDDCLAARGVGTFDVVVLCNVLHEIDPDEWLGVFGKQGFVSRSLSTNGHLLLVEDLRIPIGELPNPRGFFLLDTIHIQQLFNATTSELVNSILVHDERGDGRLKAHVVPKRLVESMTATTRTQALEALRETSLRRIKELRQSTDRSFKSGQLNGLWSQQYVNCCLYLQGIQ
jgi:predicted ATPase